MKWKMKILRATDGSACSDAPISEVARLPRRERLEVGSVSAIVLAEANYPVRIARSNPKHEVWLPILHTVRGERHYTALFSNTARAHQEGKTHDWVVIYHDSGRGERQCTVITAERGPMEGRRIVRGREGECSAYYFATPACPLNSKEVRV